MNMMKESIDIDTADRGFETLFELNPAPMLVHHMDTQRVLAVNRAALELTGLDRGTLLSLSLEDLRHPAESERFEAALQDFARGISRPGVWRYAHPDGSTLFVEGVTRAVEFQGQHAAISVLRDVTMQRRAIRAMETSERRFRDLFQHTLGFICTHDLDGVLLSVNPAAAIRWAIQSASSWAHRCVTSSPRLCATIFRAICSVCVTVAAIAACWSCATATAICARGNTTTGCSRMPMGRSQSWARHRTSPNCVQPRTPRGAASSGYA